MHRPSTSNDVADRRETTITGADDGDTVEPWNRAAGSSRRAFIKAGGVAALAALTPAALADRASAATTRPPMQFGKVYVTKKSGEEVHKVIHTSDGGYALVGTKDQGGQEGWLLKTDANGVRQWSRTYFGQPGFDRDFTSAPEVFSGVQTSDGGYALAGYIMNAVTDVDEEEPFEFATSDFWLIRTAADGTLKWEKTYGVKGSSEIARAVIQTRDGGFAFVGYTTSVPGWRSNPVAMLMKTDANGVEQGENWFAESTVANALIETRDGSYVIAGSRSIAGQWRMWLTKVGVNGTQWSRTYRLPGMASSDAVGLVRTRDGGYAVAGTFNATTGESDMWLVKTDANGVMQWNRRYSRAARDTANSLTRTRDGGYAIAGRTDEAAWLVKTDARGVRQWAWRYAAPAKFGSRAQSVVRTRDGGLAVAGTVGTRDAFLVKFAP